MKFSTRILLITVFLFGLALRLSHLNVPFRSPDEGIYTYQAKVIAERGIDGTKALIAEYNSDSRMWLYPPPTRIGYDYALAAVMKITGIYNANAGTYLSTIASVGTLLLLVVIGLRFFDPRSTFIALLGMSVSPMDLAMARRCWQDSLLAFAGVLYLYICAEIVKLMFERGQNYASRLRSKNNFARVENLLFLPLLAVGVWCMLIKESGAVVFGFGVLWLAVATYSSSERRSRESRSIIPFLSILAVGVLGAAAAAFILIKATGGLHNILEILKHVKEQMPNNTYAIEYQTGPWYRMIQGFWILTPVWMVLSILGIATTKARGIAIFTVVFMAIAILTPYCQNMRYVSVLYVPFYLLAGAGLWAGVDFLKKKLGEFSFFIASVIITVMVVIVLVRDYHIFRHVFIDNGIVDMSIRLLREYS